MYICRLQIANIIHTWPVVPSQHWFIKIYIYNNMHSFQFEVTFSSYTKWCSDSSYHELKNMQSSTRSKDILLSIAYSIFTMFLYSFGLDATQTPKKKNLHTYIPYTFYSRLKKKMFRIFFLISDQVSVLAVFLLNIRHFHNLDTHNQHMHNSSHGLWCCRLFYQMIHI